MSESTELVPQQTREQIINKLVTAGDLSGLTKLEQVNYYRMVCQSLGLNPITKPFDLIELESEGKKKLVLYARKDCTEQLRKINKISIRIVSTQETDGLLTVTVEAIMPDGRMDTDIGSIYVKGLSGKDLANAHMRALTKAKRRATLSISGLGVLDESELDGVNQTGLGNQIRIASGNHGLDQWDCDRGVAMKVLEACKSVEAAGVTEAEWRAALPEGITSRKELSNYQAQVFVNVLRGMWINKQPKEGTANA